MEIFRFQFHKGTIKTALTIFAELFTQYFNSIKVRLKPVAAKASEFAPLFQFHKGTIKTIIFSCV